MTKYICTKTSSIQLRGMRRKRLTFRAGRVYKLDYSRFADGSEEWWFVDGSFNYPMSNRLMERNFLPVSWVMKAIARYVKNC